MWSMIATSKTARTVARFDCFKGWSLFTSRFAGVSCDQTPVLELLPLAVVSGGQVWLGIENIKSKETANAVKQLSLKPALLNRVGSD